MNWNTAEQAEAAKKQHRVSQDEARKARKRAVRTALKTGTTVGFDLGTLLEDGWGLDTIRKVYRAA